MFALFVFVFILALSNAFFTTRVNRIVSTKLNLFGNPEPAKSNPVKKDQGGMFGGKLFLNISPISVASVPTLLGTTLVLF